MIKIQDLHFSFGAHPILRGVSFQAQKGEVVALLGRSGSGKSTLLRCINLLAIPSSGMLAVGNHTVHFHPEKKHPLTQKELMALRTQVGMVFQQYNLWAHKTVLENLIEAPIHVQKRNKNTVIKEAQILLEKVGLTAQQHRYPVALSGGQQQRAAIARALMMHPAVILFDEPTSALDPEMVGEVRDVMLQLAKEGMTMVIATHELHFARQIATQTLFLDEGRVIEQGQTETVFNYPATTCFKRFLEARQ